MATPIKLGLLASLLTAFIRCHSFVEEVRQMRNGDFTSDIGYARNYMNPADPAFDKTMTYKLPDSESPFFASTDLICSPLQRTQAQSTGYPRLSAASGTQIALRYRENGHVTNIVDSNIAGKLNTGMVSVYGTSKPRIDDTFLSIDHIWNANQTGGDQRGRLLRRAAFDDGSCYVAGDGQALSLYRQQLLQPPHDSLDGRDLVCKVVVDLPNDLSSSSVYTIYWTWHWPSQDSATGSITKDQAYTSCIDIDIQ